MILDCQDINSTLQSLADYFGQSQTTIKRLLIDTDFDFLYEKNADRYGYDYFTDYLYDCFKLQFGERVVDEVVWFHLTRTMRPESYYNGILPLNEILPQIQSDLYDIVGDRICKTDWNSICKNGAPGYRQWRYQSKKRDKIHYGPYAMLVRGIAFGADEVGNHDYLKMPEIIEDMCMGIEEIYGFDLIDEFYKKAKSVIVKFREKPKTQDKIPDYIGTMLCYLYCSWNKQRLGLYCNTCYSGKGKAISQKNIVTVEVLSN